MSALGNLANVPFWWLVARASGIVGYLAIVGSMTSGVILKTRLVQRVASPIAKMEWHRILAIVGLGLVALHGVALVMDSYAQVSWTDLLVPGGTAYRPLWVSAGVITLWLMLLVSATASWRKHFSARVWKGIHMASYAVFGLATVHGVMAGTDSSQPWMMGIYVGSVALVAGIGARRALAGPNAPLKKVRRRAGTDTLAS